MKNRTFKSSILLMLLSFVVSTAVIWFIIGIITAIVLSFTKYHFQEETFNILGIIALIIAAIRLIVFTIIKVVITDKEVQIFRLGKLKESFKLSESTFDTTVVRNYFNGIYLGSKRFLIVEQKGRDKKVRLYNISQKDFSEILTILGSEDKNSNKHIDKNMEGSADNNIGFTKETFSSNEIKSINFPREELVANSNKKFKKSMIIYTFLFLIVFPSAILYTYFFMTGEDLIAYIIMEIFLVIMFLGLFMRTFTLLKKNPSKTPSKISVSGTTLKIDDHIFSKEDIKKITMQPPEYIVKKSSARVSNFLNIQTKHGNKKFFLGHTHLWVFEDYKDLSEMIKEWSIKNKVPFTYIYK